MKEELKKKKKIKKLAEAAGAGGIKNSISEDTREKITDGIKSVTEKALEKNNNLNKLKEKQKEVENKTGTYQVRSLNKGNEKKDAAAEKQVASRYKNDFDPRKVVPEDGPQPGVTGKGIFSLYIKNKKKK